MIFFITVAEGPNMKNNSPKNIVQILREHLGHKEFPCIAAKAALGKEQIKYFVADHLACSHQDKDILHFIYDFVDDYRKADSLYHSAIILFEQPGEIAEEKFDQLLWLRLQALADMDALNYEYDDRVACDPSSPDFSFSLKKEAFFVIGLNPGSNRTGRRFDYPSMVFNPHSQFEKLRNSQRYDTMKTVVRKRDEIFSGSVNPMLNDFGKSSEVYQYSGRKYDEAWQCPLKINHAKIEHNTTP